MVSVLYFAGQFASVPRTPVVTPSLTTQQPTSYGTAKRLHGNVESVSNSVVMMTVVCDECGARFALAHRSASRDTSLAEKQAVWLKDRFVWDHIQEKKHSGSLLLPGLPEMKAVLPAG